MRKSKTMARIRAGEVVRTCSLGHFNPAYLRHAAHYNFDCIWLDLEHRLIGEQQVQSLLSYSHQADIDIMVRAPTLEKTRLYRYLEDGAAGLMIPHVSTAEKAQMLADSVKFPPIGDRGLDGAGLDSDYFLRGGIEFTDEANAETFLNVQIETPEAVENAEAIAAVKGVDILFVGPADLALRLRHMDTDMTVESAIERVASAAKNNGVAWGVPVGSGEELKKRQSQGGQLLPRGGDFRALMLALEDWGRDFDAL